MKKLMMSAVLAMLLCTLNAQTAKSRVLVAYFTMPEDVQTRGVDAVAGASVVVKNGTVVGNVQFMAQVIQQETGADLFEIKTVQQYPLDHKPLLDQASAEQKSGARPALASTIANLADYDVLFLGYPNWWGDLPMPLYSFLAAHDLSGKTIIPFCPHGGSGFSNTVATIAAAEPGATVLRNGFTVSRNSVARCEGDIRAWIKRLPVIR